MKRFLIEVALYFLIVNIFYISCFVKDSSTIGIVYYYKKLCNLNYIYNSKNINQDLDLCVIIDKVKEINLLKELLLTED